jgi:hypothetical protein
MSFSPRQNRLKENGTTHIVTLLELNGDTHIDALVLYMIYVI